MIAVIGARGYVGSAIVAELGARHINHVSIFRGSDCLRGAVSFVGLLERSRVTAVVNCAGWCGTTVDQCESDVARCNASNTQLPQMLGIACAATSTPLYHVASGCLFSGEGPFTEEDEPNLLVGAYRESKFKADRSLLDMPESQARIFRIRMPFDTRKNSRNLLDKLYGHARLVNHTNSITYLSDFARMIGNECSMRTNATRLPVGVFNAVNPEPISTREIACEIAKVTEFDKPWFESEESFSQAVVVPRSECVLATDKLDDYGYPFFPTLKAVRNAALGRFTV